MYDWHLPFAENGSSHAISGLLLESPDRRGRRGAGGSELRPRQECKSRERHGRALQGWWIRAQVDVSPVEAYRRMMSRKGFQFPTLEKMRFAGPKQVRP